MLTKVQLPTQPGITKRRGTLLDAATVSNEFAGIDGYEALWQSYNSLTFLSSAAFCGANSKDLDQTADWASGYRFAVYGGVTCKTIGLNMDEMRSGTAAAFEAGESTAVEEALLTVRFKADVEEYEAVPMERWDTPTDISLAAAVSVKQGIALLEHYMADNYVGAGTIHAPVSIGSLAVQQDYIEYEGNTLRTKMGTKFAAGAGYSTSTSPAGVAAATGEAWVYITGEVWVGRSDLVIKQAIETSTNEVFVLGERGYIVAVDGPVAAIKVKVE
jgi:hypothetical protein